MTTVPMKKRKTKRQDVAFPIVNGIILCVLMFVTLFPVLNTVAISFNDSTDAVYGGIYLWPRVFSTKSYESILVKSSDIPHSAMISGIRAVVGTLISIPLSMMLAFVMSRRDYILRGPITKIVLFTMYVSGGLVPTYLLINNLHMLDTFWVMVIPTATNVWHIVMIRTYFQNSVPEELYEAGQLDGCTDFGYMIRVLVPLSGPIMAVIALYTAVGIWNTYFNAMIYLTRQELYPLQLFLRSILTLGQNINLDEIDDVEAVQDLIGLSNLMKYAVIVVASVPVMMIYPFVQKFFVKGVVVGSIKG